MNTAIAVTRPDPSQLAMEHGARLKRFIARRVGNAADVDDIAQSTLLEACVCAGRFNGNSRPETWLFGIAVNLIRTHYRRSRRAAETFVGESVEDREQTVWDVHGEQQFFDPSAYYEARATLRRIEAGIGSLSDCTQATLGLLVEEGLTYRDIAERLGVPIGTVRSRINRARSALSHAAHPQGEIQPEAPELCAG